MYIQILTGHLMLILTSNALTINTEKSILYSRTLIISMASVSYITFNSININTLSNGISIFNGLFNVSILSQSFNLFLFLLAGIIAMLTAFYPKSPKVISMHSMKLVNITLNTNSKQFNIIEYSLITLFIIVGAIFLMSTGDLVSLFLSLELQSYGLYILATLYRDSESSTTSALTYFLLGGLSSCFILLGSAILYVNSGTTNLDNIFLGSNIGEIYNYINNVNTMYFNTDNFEMNYFNLSLILLAVGLLFKISAAPFHFWSPDVYDGIPTIVTTFVAIIAKVSLFILLLELVSYTNLENLSIYNANYLVETNVNYRDIEWKNVLVYSSLLSLLIGSILGLTQYRIKRLFAYSTISHVGFILLALSINKIESIQAYLFYILQYSISNLNTFFILVIIGYSLFDYIYKNSDNIKLIDVKNSPVQLLNQIKGYYYINSFLAISFTITLFSFVGIPPLIGFFAKQMVLSAALDAGYIFITLIGVLTSVIGAAYYLNIVKLMFFSRSDYKPYNLVPNKSYNLAICESKINSYLSIVVSVLTMLITLFIFVPGEWFRIVSMLSLAISS